MSLMWWTRPVSDFKAAFINIWTGLFAISSPVIGNNKFRFPPISVSDVLFPGRNLLLKFEIENIDMSDLRGQGNLSVAPTIPIKWW